MQNHHHHHHHHHHQQQQQQQGRRRPAFHFQSLSKAVERNGPIWFRVYAVLSDREMVFIGETTNRESAIELARLVPLAGDHAVTGFHIVEVPSISNLK